MATNDAPSEGETLSSPAGTSPVPEKSLAAEVAAKAKKKREKVRSAWISFVGRIVAQLVGAAATISLGLMVVQHYGVGGGKPGNDVPQTGAEAPAAAERMRRIHDNRPTIVVLPFTNFSTNADLEPLADGLTESLVAELTRGGNLRVISRTSSMHYKGSRKPLSEIVRELDVDLVIEGSVSQHDQRVRVVAQLIDAPSDEHLWAQSYGRALGDVLDLQESVARVIAQDVMRAAVAQLLSRPEPDTAPAGVRFDGPRARR